MPLLKYLENDLVVEKGKENMKWFKLRKEELGGKSIRCVATCCYSTVAVHHPFYKVTLCTNIFGAYMSAGVKKVLLN